MLKSTVLLVCQYTRAKFKKKKGNSILTNLIEQPSGLSGIDISSALCLWNISVWKAVCMFLLAQSCSECLGAKALASTSTELSKFFLVLQRTQGCLFM